MQTGINLVIGLLAVAFVADAVIKLIAVRRERLHLLRHAPTLLAFLDAQMPSLLQAYRGAELERVLRSQLETLTGQSWAGKSLDPLFRWYDPRITADRLHRRAP